MNKNKGGFGSALVIISGIITVVAAVSAAVYFILKLIDRKKCCDYIECDCGYDDDEYEFDEDFDEDYDAAADEKPAADAADEPQE